MYVCVIAENDEKIIQITSSLGIISKDIECNLHNLAHWALLFASCCSFTGGLIVILPKWM